MYKLNEVAVALDMSEWEVEYLARSGTWPLTRRGSEWFLTETQLASWLVATKSWPCTCSPPVNERTPPHVAS
jgi:hypothetical protein